MKFRFHWIVVPRLFLTIRVKFAMRTVKFACAVWISYVFGIEIRPVEIP
jgi:hypothetical protein